MKRLLILATVVAMALAMVPMTAFAKGSHDKSTGGVAYGDTVERKVSFNAHGDATDAKGRVNVRNHGPAGGIDFTGDVLCYNRVDENTAQFSGEIDQIDGAGPGDPSGYFEVRVHDDGSPGTNGDMISVRRGNSSFDCTDNWTAGSAVTSGNLKVHH